LRATEAVAEAKRAIEICNACRYCEGYCAVFPAMELQRAFSDADMAYLANLCHNCKGCYHACQFSPPHAFGINLPKTFAEIRVETYEEYAWPRPLAGLFVRNGTIVSLVTAASIALVVMLIMSLRAPTSLYQAHVGPGAFYAIVPWGFMTSVAAVTFLYALLALVMGAVNFWRDTRSPLTKRVTFGALASAMHDVMTLRYLGSDGNGCNDQDETFSQLRRRLHHAMFYGFLLCFASTCVATVYDHLLGLPAPYPFWSAPVLLGALGGIGLVIGTIGLIWVKITTDQVPVARSVLGSDFALLFLLLLSAVTGLLLLALRDTGAMGILLAVHLGFILGLFLVLPYSKFVHGIYRSTALLKAAIERQEQL
jgi:citrate/tricarballylate utilization protein